MSTQSIPSLQSPRKPRQFFHGKLNLEQQKKRAKELLKQIHHIDPEGIERFRQHPRSLQLLSHSAGDIQLTHCQLVIARENGFDSWPEMKKHIDHLSVIARLTKDRSDHEAEQIALDQPDTLHIRCGSDIKHGLELAGFRGQFLEFSDPFCQGPIQDLPDDEMIELRSAFIAQAYQLDLNDAKARGRKAYQQLARCFSVDAPWRHIVFWFEHDSYDQLILAYLLMRFYRFYLQCQGAFSFSLQMICVDQVPGVPDFIGLGQLSPELLVYLWQNNREDVSKAQLQSGEQVWLALCDDTPDALQQLAFSQNLPVPMMARALQRHLQEQPDPKSGLTLTEKLTLDILHEHNDQTLTAGKLFGYLMREKEPLPWLGDLMYWYVLRTMAERDQPLIRIDVDPELKGEWPLYHVSLVSV